MTVFRSSLSFRGLSSIRRSTMFLQRTVASWKQMQNELREDTSTTMGNHNGNSVGGHNGDIDSAGRCFKKLEKLGNTSVGSQDYDAAIKHNSGASMLAPSNRSDILLKRSKVRAIMGSFACHVHMVSWLVPHDHLPSCLVAVPEAWRPAEKY